MSSSPSSPHWWPALVAGLALLGPVAAQESSLDQRIRDLARLGTANEIGSRGQPALSQAFADVHNDECVAVVASHPDDQYVLPSAWRRRHGYRVTAIVLTRGEGGQNSTGPEGGAELGALRTVETEQCARRLGFAVHHLNRQDAGFCRSAEEALELWGRQRTVEDLARALRRVRPSMVLTTHHPAEIHGHDLALLDILPEAVALAANPEAKLGLPAIPPPTLLRGTTPEEQADFHFDTDATDPLLGESLNELAYRCLTEAHRSQAPYLPAAALFENCDRFAVLSYGEFPSLGSGQPVPIPELATPLFEEMASAERCDELAARLSIEHSRDAAGLISTALELRALLQQVETEPGSARELRSARRIEALDRVVLHALAAHSEVEPTDGSVAVPGEAFGFRLRLSAAMPLLQPELEAEPGVGELRLLGQWQSNDDRTQWNGEFELLLPDDALSRDPLTELWARERFELPLRCALSFRIPRPSGEPSVELSYPLELPAVVRPAGEVRIHPRALIVPDRVGEVAFNVRVRRNTNRPLRGLMRIEAPPGLIVEPSPIVEVDMEAEPEQGFRFVLRMPDGLRAGPAALRVQFGQAADRVAIRRVPVQVPAGLSVGLIEGVDRAARDVLQQLGCEVVTLTQTELPTRSLADLDTILVDIRALRHHSAARAEFRRLLAFAERGGRLVLLYHKDSEINVEATGIRFHPRDLPLLIGKGRVTREDAPVQILRPEHPLLNEPNQLAADDWDGWVQERGLYFPAEWAEGFEPLLRIADPDMAAEDGALLYARSGEGEYVYCALSLFRQLRQLNPGACRLLANLVTPRARQTR